MIKEINCPQPNHSALKAGENIIKFTLYNWYMVDDC